MKTISFPPKWMSADVLEKSLIACPPHETSSSTVEFVFPTNCKVMIDAAVRLLSLVNQLESCSIRVILDFIEGESGAMGYLDRMGFFGHLSENVTVRPYKPFLSNADIFGGSNASLVEIAKINPDYKDKALPTRLSNALMTDLQSRSDAKELEGAAWTIFAELIDNIFSHSKTSLDGYAALQYYRNGHEIKVAVSDSGLGIMETLRPSISREYPSLSALSDVDLLVEIFKQGLSRHGSDRGCGLRGCAAKAIKFNAKLDVRLPHIRVRLVPGVEGYKPITAYYSHNLPLIWGTHICFSFKLDTPN